MVIWNKEVISDRSLINNFFSRGFDPVLFSHFCSSDQICYIFWSDYILIADSIHLRIICLLIVFVVNFKLKTIYSGVASNKYFSYFSFRIKLEFAFLFIDTLGKQQKFSQNTTIYWWEELKRQHVWLQDTPERVLKIFYSLKMKRYAMTRSS